MRRVGFDWEDVLLGVALAGIVLAFGVFFVRSLKADAGRSPTVHAEHVGDGIYRLCDQGNLIYFGGGGLAVIPGGCAR